MSRRGATSPACPGPVEIFEYYLRSREAQAHLKARFLAASELIGRESRFWAMTSGEVEDAFQSMSDELDIQVNLLLIASSEARLRLDFEGRVRQKRKDPLSRRFRRLARAATPAAKPRISMGKILKVWADAVIGSNQSSAVRTMKQLFLYRNWVAHGRSGVENESGLNEPDPFDVWQIIRRFFNASPDFEPLPSRGEGKAGPGR